MEAKIIAIGNSKGIRHSNVVNRTIVISPVKNVRDGWEDAAKRMAKAGDDADLFNGLPPTLEADEEEWTW